MTNKRNIKKRKLKLTPLGQKVVGLSAIVLTATTLLTIGIANKAVSADQKENNIPTIETIQTEMEDIFEVNNLSPIINETVVATPTPEVIPTETIATPTPVEEVIETIAPTEEVIETIEETNPEVTEVIENTSSVENLSGVSTIHIGYADDRNQASDLERYTMVRERYGALIDYVSMQTGWDSRLITALISQENPDKVDQSRNGTYGLTSINNINQGRTNPIRINGVVQQLTVDVYSLNDNTLFMDGLYGDVTVGDYRAILTEISIHSNDFAQLTNRYSPTDAAFLCLGSYNGGLGTISGSDANAALNNFTTNQYYSHDEEYYSHVLGKITAYYGDDMTNQDPIVITDLDGNSYGFYIDANYDSINTVSVSYDLANSHTL